MFPRRLPPHEGLQALVGLRGGIEHRLEALEGDAIDGKERGIEQRFLCCATRCLQNEFGARFAGELGGSIDDVPVSCRDADIIRVRSPLPKTFTRSISARRSGLQDANPICSTSGLTRFLWRTAPPRMPLDPAEELPRLPIKAA
jgi:hypothetical protein